ncbi:MAG: hypothetical protein V4515_01835 [Chloroflexota bacterium]
MSAGDNRVIVTASVKDQISGPLDKFKDKFEVLGKTAAGQGVIIGATSKLTGAAMGLMDRALAGTIGFIGDSISAASDLNETINKSKVIFGTSARTVSDFGDTASKALGQSKQEAVGAAATFGNLFNTIGVGKSQAAEMSISLVKLASDLASFNNIDPTEALDKLQSGLVGEAKPLRELGILLNEAQVSAKALALGFKPVNGQFTEGQKVQARYQLILEQSTAAQGDFARTAGELANAQRIANAELANTEALIGEKLLPAQLAATKGFLGLLEVANQFIFRDLGAELQQRVNPALEDFGGKTEWLADKIVELRGQTGDLTDEQMALAEQVKKLGSAFDIARRSVEKLNGVFDTFTGAEFDATIAAGELAQKQKELADLLKEGPASKAAADMAIYEGKVADAKKGVFDLQYQMKQSEGPEALRDWLLKVRDGLAETDTKGRAALGTMLLLNDAMVRLASMANASKDDIFIPPAVRAAVRAIPAARAHGGPVSGGSPYIVGERGPELFVPRASGSIVPNGGSVGGSSGVTVNLTYAPTLSTASDSEIRKLVQTIGYALDSRGYYRQGSRTIIPS